MVGIGVFNPNVAQAAALLADLNLLDDSRNWVVYVPDLPSRVRHLSYADEYRVYRNEGLYDCLLVDGAVLQFKRFENGDLSYCYYQGPFDIPTYEQFVLSFFENELIDVSELGDSFRDEYDDAVATANLRNTVTPIRYDYDPQHYKPCCHPAAHLHIGSTNPIRICTRRLMLPLSFTMFVVRQMYPEAWRTHLDTGNTEVIRRAIRDDLEKVGDVYHGEDDLLQLILD